MTKSTETGTAAGYAALVLEEDQDDAKISALIKKNISPDFFSESNQWFFLNDFESVKQIPLNEYGTRILEFDPRNDGYAKKLHNVFVNDGKRFIYIPVSAINTIFQSGSPLAMQQKIKDALEGEPFSELILRQSVQDSSVFYIFFAVIALFTLIFSLKTAKISTFKLVNTKNTVHYKPDLLVIIVLLPSLAIFAKWGAAGFALGAVLLAFFKLYSNLTREYFINLCENKENPLVFTEKPRFALVKASSFAVLFILICISGGINILYAFAGLFCFCLTWACTHFALAKRAQESGHRPFIPLAILPVKKTKKSFFLLPLSWTVYAFIVFYISVFLFPGNDKPIIEQKNNKNNTKLEKTLVTESDYLAHIAFQEGFSLKKLTDTLPQDIFTENSSSSEPYLHYKMDEQGLFTEFFPISRDQDKVQEQFAPFNLAKLNAFLQSDQIKNVPVTGFNRIIALLISLLLYVILNIDMAFKRKNNKGTGLVPSAA
ncbi:MAG: hypothetical protein LBV52_05965 [Spirochaetaceae bacterium]|nr:hypothetical protein [Spirochaetaceae bacterium]